MEKDTVKIVIVGHVDHGKSTLIGRLLLDTNSLPKGKIAEIKKISKELGKNTELAYLADQLKEERERNVTIDTTQIFFKTNKRDYVIIDAPGHVEFIKNMITGASLAESAVLIVDTLEGVMEQTRRHAYLISMLGLKKVIVVFNKIDLISYEQAKFEEVKSILFKFLENLKIQPCFAIPASAREGTNIAKPSRDMPWYKGPTLLKALDAIRLDSKREDKPMRFPIQDIYEIDGERILVGKVVSGKMREGNEVFLLPSRSKATIKKIVTFEKSKTTATTGENIGVVLKEDADMARGDVIVQTESLPVLTDRIKGNIFWMSDEPLETGKALTLRCATQEVKCVVEQIRSRINSSTLETITGGSDSLKINEAGEIIFKTDKPIVAENFAFIEELGRFVIEREYNLQGAGIFVDV